MKFTKFVPMLKILVAISAIVLIVYFISVELQRSSVQMTDIIHSIKWQLIMPAILCLCVYYFLSSMGFRYLINKDSGVPKLSASKSFGILNISGLSKYLPGKVWSYTILFYVLNKQGIAVSKSVFDSMIHLILTVTTPFLFMLPVAVNIFLTGLNLPARILLILLGLTVYIGCLIMSPLILKQLVNVINKIKKKKPILYVPVSRAVILKTQFYIFIAYIFYISCVSSIVFGIDSNINLIENLQIAIICIFSMIVGFMAVFVPGGLGVQEGLIYFFTGLQQSDARFTVVLPVLFRLVNIINDILVGTLSLWLVRKEAMAILFNKKGDERT